MNVGLSLPDQAVTTVQGKTSRTALYISGVFWILALALGGLHAWAAATSHSMNEDGISYLDIGDAYLRGDWAMAINAVWSPVYSWVLGLVMRMSNPPIEWEFPLVHLTNFVIYAGALLAFTFFWRQVLIYKATRDTADDGISLPDWAMWALGYTLFIWSSLNLIRLWSVTPDMIVAGLVYLAAGIIIIIRRGHSTWRLFGLLGLVLGVGYLTKTVMLPAGFVFLAAALLAVGNLRHAFPRGLFALAVFGLIAAPFIMAISQHRNRFTIGDAGQITYIRYVNRVPYPHWQGDETGSGTLKHPSRQILDTPPLYEFAEPIRATYPISYDPVYWYEGAAINFDPGRQLELVLFSSLPYYLDLFVHQQGGLVVGAAVLYLAGSSRRRWPLTASARHMSLIVPALAVLGMYALAGEIAGRYIGPFVVLLWADVLAGVRLPASPLAGRLLTMSGAVMVLFMFAVIVGFNLEGLTDLRGRPSANPRAGQQAAPPGWPGEIALELRQLGLEAGDRVGVIGSGFEAFWARLARVQIVAEMFGWEADPFWLGTSAFQSEVIRAFASTGAAAVVAEDVPHYAAMDGWHQIGSSNSYIYVLADDTARAEAQE
jgi:hypothetical protein